MEWCLSASLPSSRVLTRALDSEHEEIMGLLLGDWYPTTHSCCFIWDVSIQVLLGCVHVATHNDLPLTDWLTMWCCPLARLGVIEGVIVLRSVQCKWLQLERRQR